jgi:chemotaxis protein methyltransferase CheR
MRFRTDALGLAGGVTTILRDLIHERLGLSYDVQQFDQVADRLAPLVVARGFGSFMDYYYLLKYDGDEEEWRRVMDALAVPETYFWREIDQVRTVVDVIVPSIASASHDAPLRIWSIPCASGEEPLTLAMLLDEAGWFRRLPIEILASDASQTAIDKARAGRFGERSFRNLPPAMRERYFSRDGTAWRVASDLHARVTFDVVNLMDEEAVVRHGPVPVVLCRNVFIYFSDRSVSKAVGALARAMSRPGYLCLATSESLLRLSTPFELQEIGGTFVYVVGAAARRPAAAVGATESGSSR